MVLKLGSLNKGDCGLFDAGICTPLKLFNHVRHGICRNASKLLLDDVVIFLFVDKEVQFYYQKRSVQRLMDKLSMIR